MTCVSKLSQYLLLLLFILFESEAGSSSDGEEFFDIITNGAKLIETNNGLYLSKAQKGHQFRLK
jgi:hypothetical protein